MPKRWGSAAACLVLITTVASAQTIPAARLAILVAEERGAKEARDLAAIRTGTRSVDNETARVSIRALGRLRRPALVSDIAPGLKAAWPEIRAEAANAIAQSFLSPAAAPAPAIDSAYASLAAVLNAEEDANVRAALCEAIGRLPYTDVRQIERAESVLASHAKSDFAMDRLGVAKGLEALVRQQAGRWTPASGTVSALRVLLGVDEQPLPPPEIGEASVQPPPPVSEVAPGARIRRLALEALIVARAVDEAVLRRAASDSDPQVRRLSMLIARDASGPLEEAAAAAVRDGLTDGAPLVRADALRAFGVRERQGQQSCQAALDGTHDPHERVIIAAFEVLAECGSFPDVVNYLEQVVNGRPEGHARAWVRSGHALQALARVAPERAKARLETAGDSPFSQIRLHAARAAALLEARDLLVRLAGDPIEAVKRVATRALGGPEPPSPAAPKPGAFTSDLNAADLRRLAAPRARITIRDVGSFDTVLVTSEAPSTVLRFARLVESRAFDGRMIGGGPATLVSLTAAGDEAQTAGWNGRQNEAGLWPHVRGTLALSSEGAVTGGAQLFINVVDTPRFDHQITVFGQVLTGIDVIDRIVEGDVIDSIVILP